MFNFITPNVFITPNFITPNYNMYTNIVIIQHKYQSRSQEIINSKS